MTAPRRRADLVLVERGIFESRARARAAIEAGLVRISGQALRKPSDTIAPDAEIEASEPFAWVSRGGLKLVGALDAFGIDPSGLVALDLGASTGGFTDVLLARGASHVHAIDVGRGQLHPKLAADPRVTSREGTDARELAGLVPERAIGIATLDLSFISLRLVLPCLLPYLRPDAIVIALVKPQFEVGRAGVGRGGIVRDEALREEALAGIEAEIRRLGLEPIGTIPSPIEGGDGNREYLIAASFPREPIPSGREAG